MNKLTVIKNDEIAPSNPIVLERVYEALDLAKEGGVDSCAIIMISQDGHVMDCWAKGQHPFEMVGAMEALKRDFMDHHIEGR